MLGRFTAFSYAARFDGGRVVVWPERMTQDQQDPLRCQAHASMLTQSEFRWVMGVLVPLMLAVLAAAWSNAASVDRVDAVDGRVCGVEARVGRLEDSVQNRLRELQEQQQQNHIELLRRLDANPAP